MTIEVKVQNENTRFSIPSDICKLFSFKYDSKISLIIRSLDLSQEVILRNRNMASGYEIYGNDLPDFIKPGEKIILVVSKPD